MRSKLISQNPTFLNPNFRPNFARNSAAPRLLRAEGPRASSKRPVCFEQAMWEGSAHKITEMDKWTMDYGRFGDF